MAQKVHFHNCFQRIHGFYRETFCFMDDKLRRFVLGRFIGEQGFLVGGYIPTGTLPDTAFIFNDLFF
jgi:hypothetical protein